MLVRPSDAASDAEWRAVVGPRPFVDLIAPGRDRDLPVVVPTHAVFDGDRTLLVHLARANPVWAALDERPRALVAIAADVAFVPGQWNALPGTPPEAGIPTSYYSAVQLECDVEVLDTPEAVAEVLRTQVGAFQPEGGLDEIAADRGPYASKLAGIRGARLTVTGVRAKQKFGGNRSAEHRLEIAAHLEARDAPGDRAAREQLLRRLAAEGAPDAG